MKYLMIPLLALTCLMSTPDLEAGCKRPPQGPPGPTGATGTIVSNRIGSISDEEDDPQELTDSTQELVLFPINTAAPVGINKTNDTTFTVLQSGTYIITATVNVFTNDVDSNLAMAILVNGTAVQDPMVSTNFSGANEAEASLSTQIVIDLVAGDEIEVGVTGFFDIEATMSILHAQFSITQIAP